MDTTATATRTEPLEPLAALAAFQVPAGVATEWQAFVQLYRALRHPQQTWPVDAQDSFSRATGPRRVQVRDRARAAWR